MDSRVESLRGSLEAKGLDGYLLTDEKDIFYFINFEGGFRLLIPMDEEPVLYVTRVNYEAARESLKDVRIELASSGIDADEKLVRTLKELGLRRVGFDALKASTYIKLRRKLRGVKLEPMKELVWTLRKVKDEKELELMRRAGELTSIGMRRITDFIKVGMREYELAAEVEYVMRRKGSGGVAFDTIIASGPRSAFPHGGCGDRRLREGEIVVVDIGAKYRGYCADMTRTFILGRASPKQREIYEAVMVARGEALNSLRAGVKASEVDGVARDVIRRRGYGEYFVHGLGHGVGLEVHEPPTLNERSEDILQAGNVITIEPGIYIVGFGGVRIEDTVLVLEGGFEGLTEAPCVFEV